MGTQSAGMVRCRDAVSLQADELSCETNLPELRINVLCLGRLFADYILTVFLLVLSGLWLVSMTLAKQWIFWILNCICELTESALNWP